MSLTVEQVLEDAKRLVDRLRDHDNAADSLIEQSTTLNKRIEAMKQYQEEVEEMNSVARHRPRSALILGIQQENRQIRELQRENRELRVALEEHQSALDLIMSSYREQVCRMLMANRFDKDCLEKHAEYHENSLDSTSKIIEMAAVMKHAIELEEKTSFDVEQQLTRLQVENRGLRELLGISRAVHLHHSPVTQDEKKDKEKDPIALIPVTEGASNLPDDEPPPPKTNQSPPPKTNQFPPPKPQQFPPRKTNQSPPPKTNQPPPPKINKPPPLPPKANQSLPQDTGRSSRKHPSLKTLFELEKTVSEKRSDGTTIQDSSVKTRFIDIQDGGNIPDIKVSDSDDVAVDVNKQESGGESGGQQEGAIDLEVENVLNDFADMTAGLDDDDDDSDESED